MQFATEAALLCAAGGVAGLPAGAALAGIIALFARWPVSVSRASILAALLLATGVGVAFGVYPAHAPRRSSRSTRCARHSRLLLVLGS